jgi:hypothetical protein
MTAYWRRLLAGRRRGHPFHVASAGIEYDVLQLAEDATAEWHRFLSSQGLIS